MVKPTSEWPSSTKPFRSNPPEGTCGLVLPIRDNLKFFKLALHSILDFTDYRYMLTVVDNMSGFTTRQYLESIRRNHPINVLQYQKPHNLAAEWNLGATFMFAFASVRYAAFLTPSVVMEPNWLSKLVRALQAEDVAAVEPHSNLCNHDALLHPSDIELLQPSCVALSRPSYERLGGFNEQRADGCCVAQDFGDRARKAGLRLLCVGDVSIHAYSRYGWPVERSSAPQEITL